MNGFNFAMSEYEAKLNDPYDDEECTEQDYDNYFTDEIEERMLEDETESFLWGY